MRIASRNDGDTVGLFERSFPVADELQRPLAQGARSRDAGRLLEFASRRARCDHLPEFVVHDEKLADCLAAAVAGAPAVTAATALAKTERRRLRTGEARFGEHGRTGPVLLGALG